MKGTAHTDFLRIAAVQIPGRAPSAPCTRSRAGHAPLLWRRCFWPARSWTFQIRSLNPSSSRCTRSWTGHGSSPATWAVCELQVEDVSLHTEMSFNMDEAQRSYRNLTLSYRGSERQPPNNLQLALRFSRVMEVRADEGLVVPTASTMERLRSVIAEFHASGLNPRHQLDDNKVQAIYNLIAGTCPAPWCDFSWAWMF